MDARIGVGYEGWATSFYAGEKWKRTRKSIDERCTM